MNFSWSNFFLIKYQFKEMISKVLILFRSFEYNPVVMRNKVKLKKNVSFSVLSLKNIEIEIVSKIEKINFGDWFCSLQINILYIVFNKWISNNSKYKIRILVELSIDIQASIIKTF